MLSLTNGQLQEKLKEQNLDAAAVIGAGDEGFEVMNAGDWNALVVEWVDQVMELKRMCAPGDRWKSSSVEDWLADTNYSEADRRMLIIVYDDHSIAEPTCEHLTVRELLALISSFDPKAQVVVAGYGSLSFIDPSYEGIYDVAEVVEDRVGLMLLEDVAERVEVVMWFRRSLVKIVTPDVIESALKDYLLYDVKRLMIDDNLCDVVVPNIE